MLPSSPCTAVGELAIHNKMSDEKHTFDEKHEQYDATVHDVPRSGSTADVGELKEQNVYDSNILVDQNLMSNAFEGENYEHGQGLWAAFKSHPMAAMWAFIMCFTIVSLCNLSSVLCLTVAGHGIL